MRTVTKICLVVALALALSFPLYARAGNEGPVAAVKTGEYAVPHENAAHKGERFQQQVMAWVKTYAPELEKEFAAAFASLKEAKKQKRAAMDDETKKKLKEIRKKVKEGTLTKEQARAELERLGIPVREKSRLHVLQRDLQAAVRKNDEAKVRSLLAQLLTELQNKAERMKRS